MIIALGYYNRRVAAEFGAAPAGQIVKGYGMLGDGKASVSAEMPER